MLISTQSTWPTTGVACFKFSGGYLIIETEEELELFGKGIFNSLVKNHVEIHHIYTMYKRLYAYVVLTQQTLAENIKDGRVSMLHIDQAGFLVSSIFDDVMTFPVKVRPENKVQILELSEEMEKCKPFWPFGETNPVSFTKIANNNAVSLWINLGLTIPATVGNGHFKLECMDNSIVLSFTDEQKEALLTSKELGEDVNSLYSELKEMVEYSNRATQVRQEIRELVASFSYEGKPVFDVDEDNFCMLDRDFVINKDVKWNEFCELLEVAKNKIMDGYSNR